MMKCFLKHGVDVNLTTILKHERFYDKKPLHMLVQQNSDTCIEAAKLLLKHGANVNARDSKLNTPLHYMRYNTQVKMIDLLLNYGADLDACNALSETPLLSLVSPEFYDQDMSNLLEKIGLFLDRGADIYSAHVRRTTLLNLGLLLDDLYIEWTLVEHAIKLKSLGFPVSDTHEKLYTSLFVIIRSEIDYDANEFRERCVVELERLRKISINKHTTLYDVLFKSLEELTMIGENNRFIEILKHSDIFDKCSSYALTLESQAMNGKARRSLLKIAEKVLNFLTGLALPCICTENIFQSLDNEDLCDLIQSRKSPTF
ncbi:hypothetical protein QAD02_006894 [Eretmocerus hayati]|uniref:Uncharacterized protein n=1 Tax=Eretmocerus hayati TaxID=131215 RepID=A0ACC2N4G9_9HYME|nr:hypothetical protein QAD02_006894 [Eretmocerus hayati]